MGSASTRAHPGRRPNRAGPALRSWIALWEREREVNTCSPCLAQRKTQPKGVATAGPVHAKAPSTRRVVGPVIANDRTPSSSAAGEHRSCVQGTEWAIQVAASSRPIASVWSVRPVQTPIAVSTHDMHLRISGEAACRRIEISSHTSVAV